MLKKILPKWQRQQGAALFELTQKGQLNKIRQLWPQCDAPFAFRKSSETQLYKRGWSIFEYAVYYRTLLRPFYDPKHETKRRL